MTRIIGNGESRLGVDISQCQGVIVGCNAIHRDFAVDHLVCVDRRMVKDAQSNNFSGKIYTRKDWVGQFDGVEIVPDLPYHGSQRWDEPFQWGSGPYAVLLGCLLSEDIHMLGFDLHSKTKTVNNIYKGTNGYDAENKHAVDPRYWIHQIGKLIHIFPYKHFTIYNDNDWTLPESWKMPNVSVDNTSNL